MLIVIADTGNTDLDQLNALLDQYDHANSADQKEQVAGRIHDQIGDQIESMIRGRTRGIGLDAEQTRAAGWEALLKGLDMCGVTQFQRSSAAGSEWGGVIQKCRPACHGQPAKWNYEYQRQTPAGARIWDMLSPAFRQALSQYPPLQACNRALADRFVAELNAIIRRRDFYASQAWADVSVPQEAQALLAHNRQLGTTEVTRLNATLLASAFPEIALPPPPKRNLMGFISSSVIPGMLSELYEGATGKTADSFLADAHGFLKPDIEAVERMRAQGTLPDGWEGLSLADQIYREQRRRIATVYLPRLAWWSAQVKKYQPGNPFEVRDRGGLQYAKQLLTENRVDERLWKYPNSEYYIPTRALHIYGVEAIQRMLDSTGPQGPAAAQPTLTPAPAQPADPGRNFEWLLADGIPERAYLHLVQKLFLPQSAECMVGEFVAQNPTCTAKDAEAFIRSLPEDIADDIRFTGWDRLVREIDEKILAQFKDPRGRMELERALGKTTAEIAIDRIRRIVICRGRFGLIRIARRGTWAPMRRSAQSGLRVFA